MPDNARLEKDIFLELSELCASPGYIHAIAAICFRDNTIRYSDKLTGDHLSHFFSQERLIRTEISTLIGLMCKNEFSSEHFEPEKSMNI
ncbi:hypothetical protein RE428_35970 [Marinobacter nanhaiticus D15-8W]|uniref:Uncharacterized protein n=1 Tax=Marinobacter nanhaiticus D15-8W TaxID=626887 RepID=A0A371CGD5_9GAMM|nr:hypothetical protein [Marinobacter nanhaiticus]RDW95462.1 hypothetical protein J057_24120 [Marinobacter nanhaiticus D15-8W]BES72579.1 hypothetical protein RE428_35970 [Marinobacter nanhaiticus D15-8W]